MTQVTPFIFDGAPVRVVPIDGEAYFVARDVALTLGYVKPENAIPTHCKATLKRGIPTPGGIQEMTLIPERDVYRLIMRSRLASAERFEEWVVGEVLPSIRKTGVYSHEATTSAKLAGELAIAECFTRLLKPSPSSQIAMLSHIAKNHGLEPAFLPASAVDATPDSTMGSSMETRPITDLLVAHGISISPRTYNRLLADAGMQAERTRRSSSSRAVNGTRRFWAITEAGLLYGKNITNPNSPRETQPHWYVDRFTDLHALVSSRVVGAST
ncbi:MULTISPECIES: BRO family protein [unclassified Caballeronia]|uniref:BRO-N domain-containing protein n=1 Tax=unclassified Caballeronia TaxID=2646786 RepID=UPI00285AA947|nr:MULTISPECIES: BRO family protein [unclassified Caballeronia]MDR5777593.1 BRO family protein [Caballeronia sp. LZ002]MDR5802349.1 BRO family protein [Caballeronia sp. LZ001]MDR5853033.1 BRO family protein [Caballeronia sp. LZ003]